jgi:putative hemolysin
MRDRTHIALFRGSDGRVVGMVTMEDILEKMLGDIQDEYDRLPGHLQRSGRGWVMGGGVELDRLTLTTGVDLRLDKGQAARNLSEWVESRHGPVRGGEVLESPQARIVVRKVRRHKVQEAQVTRT